MQVYVIDSVNSQSGIQRFCERVSGVQYFLEHHNGFFYFLTNAPITEGDVIGYYLARCRVEDLPLTNHQNLILSTGDTSLLDMDIFNDYLVLCLNKEGTSAMCSIDLPALATGKKGMKVDDYDPWYFPLPSNICTMVAGSNHDFMSTVYRVVLSSPTMPDVLVDYDMSRKTHSVVLQEEITNMYHRSNESVDFKSTSELKGLRIERVNSSQKNDAQTVWDFSDTYCCVKKEAISYDGTRVPLTILYSRELHQKNQCPGLLHGYGAYGEVLDKSWCADFLSLLDRGWVIAFADVRGGAGSDPCWHSSGSGMNKLNSIYDYVSCGKYLVSEGYVHEEQLSAVAHSAGCLLVGAAINMHPDLFRAAILKAPFLDVCNTLLNPDLPLTILDYEEFGNPRVKAEFHNILKYSPYDNIGQGLCCPATLVTSAFNDSRVGVWEAAKWVARIRDTACRTCSSSVIFRSRMDGGHFGEGGRFGHCKEVAYEYAFLMKAMGISHKLPKP